jgi:hypothetical protein
MAPLSVLDLSPITEESDARQALTNSRDLGRHVEALGYQRFWDGRESQPAWNSERRDRGGARPCRRHH